MNETTYNLFGLVYEQWLILSTVITLTVSIVAICISVLTLKQNNKMIEESSRPIIIIYSEFVDKLTFIVVKNFGKSLAQIDDINCDYSFTPKQAYGLSGDLFKYLGNSALAPSQVKRIPLVGFNMPENIVININVKYHSKCNSYCDEFAINITTENPYPIIKHSTKDQDLKHISNALQEMVQRSI